MCEVKNRRCIKYLFFPQYQWSRPGATFHQYLQNLLASCNISTCTKKKPLGAMQIWLEQQPRKALALNRPHACMKHLKCSNAHLCKEGQAEHCQSPTKWPTVDSCARFWWQMGLTSICRTCAIGIHQGTPELAGLRLSGGLGGVRMYTKHGDSGGSQVSGLTPKRSKTHQHHWKKSINLLLFAFWKKRNGHWWGGCLINQ